MSGSALTYVGFGLALVILLGAIIAHYYSRKRHKKVEEAKFRMLKDED